MVERLLLLAEGEVTAAEVELALPAQRGATQIVKADDCSGPLAARVMSFERAAVLAELARHDGNVTQTAKALGLERSHFYKKCQQVGVDLQRREG